MAPSRTREHLEARAGSSLAGYSRISHTRIVHAEDIRGFEIKPGMQQAGKVWYDLWLQVAAGKDANAGTGMDKTEAEWFAAEAPRPSDFVHTLWIQLLTVVAQASRRKSRQSTHCINAVMSTTLYRTCLY